MARKIRVFIEKTPHVVKVSALDELLLFKDKEDYKLFLSLLLVLSKQYNLHIHSYLLMPKYFLILATPKEVDSISKFIQTIGRKYVAYYNKKYSRRGSLFNGRYKLSIVEANRYLFDVMVYIESLPSRAKEYQYSSIGKNFYNRKDDIVSFHELYKKLGSNRSEQIDRYQKIFSLTLTKEKREFITSCIKKQSIIGTKGYIKDLEQKLGASLIAKKRGRPPKIKREKRKTMYKKLVLLDKNLHKDLKIKPMQDLEFAKDLAFIPILASEVKSVGKIFPIVFTNDENPRLVAIVSLGGSSLALNDEFKWISEYVPMYLRSYPFSISNAKVDDETTTKVILIDEDSHLVSATEGEALFDEDGNNTETLNRAMEFLKSYDEQMSITNSVAKEIKNSAILEEREISVGEGEDKQVLVKGFSVVDREKLNGLSDEVLANWVRRGIITMIDGTIDSLANIQTLFNLYNAKNNG